MSDVVIMNVAKVRYTVYFFNVALSSQHNTPKYNVGISKIYEFLNVLSLKETKLFARNKL